MRGSRLGPGRGRGREYANEVDQQTLRSIGLGSPKGIIFFDLNAATEKRDWVLEYAKELLAKDKQAFDNDWP